KKRTLKSVAASVADDAPPMEPQLAAEDVDLKKELEESMKSIYDVPRGPIPPVVIREPETNVAGLCGGSDRGIVGVVGYGGVGQKSREME
nr:hypothetical protein [Tanacetum cinerariifolium]